MGFELGPADYRTLHISSTLDVFKGMCVAQGPYVAAGMLYDK